MLQECGLTKDTVRNMKDGKKPYSDTIARIAQYLEISVENLMGVEEPKAPPQSRSAMEDEIIERLEVLSSEEQKEALGYLDYLVHRRNTDTKAP